MIRPWVLAFWGSFSKQRSRRKIRVLDTTCLFLFLLLYMSFNFASHNSSFVCFHLTSLHICFLNAFCPPAGALVVKHRFMAEIMNKSIRTKSFGPRIIIELCNVIYTARPITTSRLFLPTKKHELYEYTILHHQKLGLANMVIDVLLWSEGERLYYCCLVCYVKGLIRTSVYSTVVSSFVETVVRMNPGGN